MAGDRYAIAMTSVCATPGNFCRLTGALLEIDGSG
jgi:hypothetical protein